MNMSGAERRKRKQMRAVLSSHVATVAPLPVQETNRAVDLMMATNRTIRTIVRFHQAGQIGMHGLVEELRSSLKLNTVSAESALVKYAATLSLRDAEGLATKLTAALVDIRMHRTNTFTPQ